MSDYSNDIETYQIDDQYLIGEDLLVAPIIYGQTQRKVYVPQGCWVDYWTGEAIGGGWHDVQTEDIPVYVKQQ